VTEIRRIVLRELQERANASQEVAQVCALSEAEVLYQLHDLNERVKKLLGKSNDRGDLISVTANGAWRADGVAGLLRLNQQVELEIVPKFLDCSNETWRRDFFLLALLVRTGHLLHHDEISADSADRGDLATLVARSLLRMCNENKRRPIRRYRRSRTVEFSLDGDVDWETLTLPDPDGYTVSRFSLTGRNAYNATIKAAAGILAREVTDNDTVADLTRLSRSLGDQSQPHDPFPALPQRHLDWEGAYTLAKLVVEGFGLDLTGGRFSGPGFIISTWQSWEQLCYEIVRRALRGHKVVAQQGWVLGKRGNKDELASPDISPHLGESTDFLLDAKYKVPPGQHPSVGRDDVYEAIAFLYASGRKNIYLLYPSVQTPDKLPLGQWQVFDTLTMQRDGWAIRGVEVQVQGIASRGGFDAIVQAARAALADSIESAATAG